MYCNSHIHSVGIWKINGKTFGEEPVKKVTHLRVVWYSSASRSTSSAPCAAEPNTPSLAFCSASLVNPQKKRTERRVETDSELKNVAVCHSTSFYGANNWSWTDLTLGRVEAGGNSAKGVWGGALVGRRCMCRSHLGVRAEANHNRWCTRFGWRGEVESPSMVLFGKTSGRMNRGGETRRNTRGKNKGKMRKEEEDKR